MRLGGIGSIWTVPSIGATPIPIAIAKSASIDFKQERKPLRGQWMDPIDMLAGARDISIKLTNNDFRAATAQLAMQGMTLASGATRNAAVGESWTIPATPYQIGLGTSPAIANAATWSEDAGILDVTAGKWLVKGASYPPTTGQYFSQGPAVFSGTSTTTTLTVTAVASGKLGIGSVLVGGTAGTTITAILTGTGGIGTYTISASQTATFTSATASYTFAAADTGHNITGTYSYTAATAGSQTGTLNAQLVGPSTGYLVRIFTSFLVGGIVKSIGLEFPNVHFSDFSLAFKNDDWSEESLTGMVAQDTASTLVCSLYTGE